MNWIQAECYRGKKQALPVITLLIYPPSRCDDRLNQTNYSNITSYSIMLEVQEGIQREQPVITQMLLRPSLTGAI